MLLKKQPVEQQVIFITGASSGLGAGLAERYVSEGHCVMLFARNESALQDLSNQLANLPGEVLVYSGDVTNAQSLESALRATVDRFGRLDCVIANAGVGYSTPGFDFDLSLFSDTIAVNLVGVAATYSAALPYFLAAKAGHFVTISSLAAYRGLPCNGAYAASKAGVSAFTESMRLDLKHLGISVSLICPGYIQTPLTDRNDFHMPFLLSTSSGVARIYRAIRSRRSVYAFPFLPAMAVRVLRLLPAPLVDFILAGRRVLKRKVT